MNNLDAPVLSFSRSYEFYGPHSKGILNSKLNFMCSLIVGLTPIYKNITMFLAGIDTNFTLPPRFYTSNEIFEAELERIFYSRWIYVACEADIPKPGDYVALKLGARSFFLQRTGSGEVRGFYNVCRHRGHELVAGEKGNCRRLICPYHNWTYDLNGNLLHARGMNPDFPKEDFRLNPIYVEVIGGLIYVCLNSPAPPDIEEVRSKLTPYLAPYELP